MFSLHPDTTKRTVMPNPLMVAGASLVVHNNVGHLAGAATLASARGRGAQSALIAARVQTARELGVRRCTPKRECPQTPVRIAPSIT